MRNLRNWATTLHQTGVLSFEILLEVDHDFHLATKGKEARHSRLVKLALDGTLIPHPTQRRLFLRETR